MAYLPYPRCPILWILWILWENSAPQPSVFIRVICGRKDIPTERTEHTEPSGREEPPTDGTDEHRLGGYGIPAIPTLPSSVYSVNSVGEQRTPTICVHPCHLWEKRYSRRTHTQNLLAEKILPQMNTDVHRLGWYGIPAIPTLPNSVNSV